MSPSDLYDADQRSTNDQVRQVATTYLIPHPLNNVQYADGISRCRHAKKRGKWAACQQEVRPS